MLSKKEMDNIDTNLGSIIHRLNGLLDESYAYEFFLGTTLELEECRLMAKEAKDIISNKSNPAVVVTVR